MADLAKVFSLLALVFFGLGLIFNLYPRLPRLPGDIYLDKPAIKIYLPVVSSLILSVILTVLFNFFRH